MKPLTIEINNHSKNNRGDELMAIAMIEKLRELHPEARLVGNYNIDPGKRLANGLYVTNEIPGRPGHFPSRKAKNQRPVEPTLQRNHSILQRKHQKPKPNTPNAQQRTTNTFPHMTSLHNPYTRLGCIADLPY